LLSPESIGVLCLLIRAMPLKFRKHPCFVEKCSPFSKRREKAVSHGKDGKNLKGTDRKSLSHQGKIACFPTITGENREREGETGSLATGSSATQSGLRGVISRWGRIADIPAG